MEKDNKSVDCQNNINTKEELLKENKTIENKEKSGESLKRALIFPSFMSRFSDYNL